MSSHTENNPRQARLSGRRWLNTPSFLRGRLLAQLTLAYIAGVLLGFVAKLPFLHCGVLALLLSILAVLMRKHVKTALTLLLLAMVSLGCCLCVRSGLMYASFPVIPGEEASVYGRAATASVDMGEGRFRLQMAVKQVNGQPWQGQIYVYHEGEPVARGSYAVARGKVMGFTPYGNPGAFDYGEYMRRQGIATALSCYYDGELHSAGGPANTRGSVRSRLLDAFNGAAGESSALLTGVFLGDKADLSFAQKDVLTFSGMMHAFAVSGLHVGYLVSVALLLAGPGRKRRWLRLGLVTAMLLFYLRLTGLPAPILRAALMALILLTASAADEKNDPYTALALAALLCLLYRPLWLMDAGFLLSFAAALGLLYLLPVMRSLLRGQCRQGKVAAMLTDTMAVTLAASFATMPLIGYYFYNISIVGWLITIPFVLGSGLAVICCFAASLLAVFSATLAMVPMYIADIIMRLLYGLSAWGSSFSWSYISSGHTPAWAVVAFYVVLLLLPLLSRGRSLPRLLMACTLSLLVVFLAFSPALARALARPSGSQLEVVFIDVGQGDAALVVTPTGKTMLIDGGGNRFSAGSVGENVLIPYLRYRGLRGIDVLISSHPDEDHIDGLLSVLEHMPVGQLLYADVFENSEMQQRLLQLARDNGTTLTPAYDGQRFTVENGLTLEIYNPPLGVSYSERNYNDGSVTMLLTYGKIDFLFTGDVILGGMERIPQAEIVKIPHHGSKNNYDEQAYGQLQAEAVIISAGRDNSYGHPAPSVIEYWQGRAAIFRTDWQGAISVFSDGHSWQARTYWPYQR